MNETLLAVIGAAAAILGGGGYFAYRSAKRSTSGKISTTEAATLWEESSKIRHEAVERARGLQAEVDTLRVKVHDLEEKCLDQDLEIARLRQENTDSMRVVQNLRAEVETLSRRVDENGH